MRKTTLLFIIWLLTSSIPLTALADGEQVEGGLVWVDPVEFFHLQDITTTDLRRDYDQGDIDINEVLKLPKQPPSKVSNTLIIWASVESRSTRPDSAFLLMKA